MSPEPGAAMAGAQWAPSRGPASGASSLMACCEESRRGPPGRHRLRSALPPPASCRLSLNGLSPGPPASGVTPSPTPAISLVPGEGPAPGYHSAKGSHLVSDTLPRPRAERYPAPRLGTDTGHGHGTAAPAGCRRGNVKAPGTLPGQVGAGSVAGPARSVLHPEPRHEPLLPLPAGHSSSLAGRSEPVVFPTVSAHPAGRDAGSPWLQGPSHAPLTLFSGPDPPAGRRVSGPWCRRRGNSL